jgi:hypothetical protein
MPPQSLSPLLLPLAVFVFVVVAGQDVGRNAAGTAGDVAVTVPATPAIVPVTTRDLNP